jgi:hypothetical protein
VTDYPNWFAQTAQHNFEQFLTPLAGTDKLRFLQLGAFTGDASVWLCDNVLTGTYCYLTDVDTWEGSDEPAHKDMDFVSVYDTYRRKTDHYQQVLRVTSTTMDFLNRPNKNEIFDFIYVDADHTTVGVILDAELSWPLLKSGGIMAFDDYTWGHESGDPRLAPMVGIDLFLHRHQGDYELLAKNDQVWIRKR